MRLALAAIIGVTSWSCTAGPGQERSGTPRDALRDELLGCFALYTPRGKLLDSTFYNSSPRVRLDSLPGGIPAPDTMPGLVRRVWRLHPAAQRLDPEDP